MSTNSRKLQLDALQVETFATDTGDRDVPAGVWGSGDSDCIWSNCVSETQQYGGCPSLKYGGACPSAWPNCTTDRPEY